MADFAITPANVIMVPGTRSQIATASQTINAGQLVQVLSGSASLPTNDTAADAQVSGMAVTSAVAGQPLIYCSAGSISVGTVSGLISGQALFLSANAGMICPDTDLSSGKYVTQVGFAASATAISLAINNTGIAHG
jgi:hypothetical protein